MNHREVTAKSFIKISKILLILSILALTGCSTITGSGSNQSISVQTYSADGSDVDGAKCDMTNDEGTWFVITPGSATIHRSNKDLQVICKKAGLDTGTAQVVSRTKGNMFGNIILGGGIGAIVDHNNGTAYEYPGLVKIFMGKSNGKIDEKSPQASAAPIQVATSSNTPNSSSSPQNSDSKNSGMSLNEAERKCEELGFSKGTKEYGSCVMKISK